MFLVLGLGTLVEEKCYLPSGQKEMAQIPTARLLKPQYKPIRRDCAMYFSIFSTTVSCDGFLLIHPKLAGCFDVFGDGIST